MSTCPCSFYMEVCMKNVLANSNANSVAKMKDLPPQISVLSVDFFPFWFCFLILFLLFSYERNVCLTIPVSLSLMLYTCRKISYTRVLTLSGEEFLMVLSFLLAVMQLSFNYEKMGIIFMNYLFFCVIKLINQVMCNYIIFLFMHRIGLDILVLSLSYQTKFFWSLNIFHGASVDF